MPIVHNEDEDPSGGNVTVNAPSQWSPFAQGAGNLAKGLAVGAGKGFAGMVPETVYNWVGAPGAEIKSWSSSPGDPNSQIERGAEWVGDVGANVAPWFAMPEVRLGGLAAEGLGNLALNWRRAQQAKAMASAYSPAQVAKAAQAGQKTFQRLMGTGVPGTGIVPKVGSMIDKSATGAIAGGITSAIQNESETDPWTFARNVAHGAVEGGAMSGVFAAGRMGFEALPPHVQSLIKQGTIGMTVGGSGLMLINKAGGHHWVPWHMLSTLAYPLLETAKGVTKLPPAVVGAGQAWITQHGGPSVKMGGDEDTVVNPDREPEGPPAQSSLLNQPDAPQEPDQPDQTDDQNQ